MDCEQIPFLPLDKRKTAANLPYVTDSDILETRHHASDTTILSLARARKYPPY
jgi:hypothetical protein